MDVTDTRMSEDWVKIPLNCEAIEGVIVGVDDDADTVESDEKLSDALLTKVVGNVIMTLDELLEAADDPDTLDAIDDASDADVITDAVELLLPSPVELAPEAVELPLEGADVIPLTAAELVLDVESVTVTVVAVDASDVDTAPEDATSVEDTTEVVTA